jgi:predicted DNA binding CopG/RHH family protein
MRRRRHYRQLPDVEIEPRLDKRARQMTGAAARDLEETRVNFRWRRSQLAIVKRAAEVLGIPYQTYLKQVVFRQALADIGAVERITARAASRGLRS